MQALDYLLLAGLAVWVLVSVLWMRRRRRQGRCIGCSGNCAACSAPQAKKPK